MDEDGITEESLDALEQVAAGGSILERVEIAGSDASDVLCSFVFKDHGVYNASGFSIGYSGEGPHGLYEAIRLFHPDKIEESFGATPIRALSIEHKWNWIPEKGFLSV